MSARFALFASAQRPIDSFDRWQPLPPPTGAQDQPWTSWRLLSANNHELGRSACTFCSLDECVKDVARTVALAPALVATVERSAPWSWQLDADGAAVAVSGRPFTRLSLSRLSLARFRANLVASTVLSSQVTILRQRGSSENLDLQAAGSGPSHQVERSAREAGGCRRRDPERPG